MIKSPRHIAAWLLVLILFGLAAAAAAEQSSMTAGNDGVALGKGRQVGEDRMPSPFNLSTERQRGRNVGEFITPDGRFDLAAAQRSGYQGPLDMKGFKSAIDPVTGQPLFRPSGSQETAGNPDDIYWENSISPSILGSDGNVYATTVYDGKLIIGGDFAIAGSVKAHNIATWDGSSWSPLGSGWSSPVFVDTRLCGFGRELPFEFHRTDVVQG